MILPFRNRDIIYYIDTADLYYCKSAGNYAYLISKEKNIMCYQSLDDLSELLRKFDYFRCHKSYIVNLASVSSFNIKSCCLVMKNKAVIKVSIRKRKDMKKALEDFINKDSFH